MNVAAEAETHPLVAASRRAMVRAGVVRSSFRLAGHTIRLEGAGPALHSRFAPAFAHLPVAPDHEPADLTVLLWDTASTGEMLPPSTGLPQPGEMAGLQRDGDRTMILHPFERSASFLDHSLGLGVYATEDAASLPSWERAAPLRTLLTWWLAPRGQQMAHAAAVGDANGAALLVGAGGSGKSTSALACLSHEARYLGDDYVLLEPATGTVWSVYGSAKLAPEQLGRFPGLLAPEPAAEGEPVDQKRVGWPLLARPEATLWAAPIRAVLLPTVTGRCRLTPTSPARALLGIAPYTMFQTPSDHRLAFTLCSELVRRTPVFSLEVGPSLEDVAATVFRSLDASACP